MNHEVPGQYFETLREPERMVAAGECQVAPAGGLDLSPESAAKQLDQPCLPNQRHEIEDRYFHGVSGLFLLDALKRHHLRSHAWSKTQPALALKWSVGIFARAESRAAAGKDAHAPLLRA